MNSGISTLKNICWKVQYMCQHETVGKKLLRQTSSGFVGLECSPSWAYMYVERRDVYSQNKATSILLLLLVVNGLPQQPNSNRKKSIFT